jgi:hypothetical protein
MMSHFQSSSRFSTSSAWIALGLLVASSLFFFSQPAISMPAPQTASAQKSTMLRHVVLFQFKETSTKEDIQKVVDGFRALKAKIPQIADFEYGVNNSPEGLNNGLTHCFLVTFKTEKDRDEYLPHPAHKAFVDLLMPHLEKATVVDYWAAQ